MAPVTGKQSLLEALRRFGPMKIGTLAADERDAIDGLVAEGKITVVGITVALTRTIHPFWE
jgi:hypothetical protein